jgi:catecholate siderophore receptor
MSNNNEIIADIGADSAPCASDNRRVTQVSLGVAASMLMASAVAAQTTLPPLAVETNKVPAKAKAKAAPRAKQAPAPVAQEPAAPVDPSTLPGSYTTTFASSSKQTAPLLDTPQTVSVIPGTIIAERQATNLTEVLRNTPGISFNSGENGFGASSLNFQLRGFNASGDIYIDGSRSSGIFPRDVFSVDRVEVFKGAAADNGRGGAGGYINIVSKTPVMENFVRGEVGIGFDEYDSEMRRRATFDVNQRIGTTGIRVNGMIEDGGVAGREVAETKGWGIAPTITFGMGTDKRLTIAYEHLDPLWKWVTSASWNSCGSGNTRSGRRVISVWPGQKSMAAAAWRTASRSSPTRRCAATRCLSALT